MKKKFVCMIVFFCLVFFSGCGGAVYQDGTYTGKSSKDDTGAWGEISIVIENGRVTGCTFLTYQKDGSVKDQDYGKVHGEISDRAFYDKAQLAVRAMEKYAGEFGRTGNLKSVEAVSGATIAWNQFNEAAETALAAAKNRRP
jgi:major membrane immunogen (membrane-anchored lipoprotein)